MFTSWCEPSRKPGTSSLFLSLSPIPYSSTMFSNPQRASFAKVARLRLVSRPTHRVVPLDTFGQPVGRFDREDGHFNRLACVPVTIQFRFYASWFSYLFTFGVRFFGGANRATPLVPLLPSFDVIVGTFPRLAKYGGRLTQEGGPLRVLKRRALLGHPPPFSGSGRSPLGFHLEQFEFP